MSRNPIDHGAFITLQWRNSEKFHTGYCIFLIIYVFRTRGQIISVTGSIVQVALLTKMVVQYLMSYIGPYRY